MKELNAEAAEESGIRPGDRVLTVNGHRVEDELDYRFYAGGDAAEVEVRAAAGGDRRLVTLSREGVLGLGFVPMRSRRCRNRCLFCFVDQLPDGLRSSLYVKDEDYRFSFLYGNYVTLASAKKEELDRICRLRLQPVYVSVHATDPAVRNFLLGRRTSRPIMESLAVLAQRGIEIHTQIVLCPGINDGSVLRKTVQDLGSLYPSVASIAVVPVGLTGCRKQKDLWPIRGVRRKDAEEIIFHIEELQNIFKQKHDDCLVFPSDELYRLANRPFPPAGAYGDFPQWENGVGMIPLFLHQWERRRRRRRPRRTTGPADFVIVTGESAYPFVLPYVEWLRNASGRAMRLVPVRNRLFGRSVNVTGLITGRDLIRQIKPMLRAESVLLVPEVMLDREKERFLDDVRLKEIEETLSVPVREFPPDPTGFERVLKQFTKGL